MTKYSNKLIFTSIIYYKLEWTVLNTESVMTSEISDGYINAASPLVIMEENCQIEQSTRKQRCKSFWNKQHPELVQNTSHLTEKQKTELLNGTFSHKRFKRKDN